MTLQMPGLSSTADPAGMVSHRVGLRILKHLAYRRSYTRYCAKSDTQFRKDTGKHAFSRTQFQTDSILTTAQTQRLTSKKKEKEVRHCAFSQTQLRTDSKFATTQTQALSLGKRQKASQRLLEILVSVMYIFFHMRRSRVFEISCKTARASAQTLELRFILAIF